MIIAERAQAVGMIRARTLADMYVTHRYKSCTMFNYLLLSAKNDRNMFFSINPNGFNQNN